MRNRLAGRYVQDSPDQVRRFLERLTATFARESAGSAELLWVMPLQFPSSLLVQAVQSLGPALSHRADLDRGTAGGHSAQGELAL